jgi:hypothetical protein
MCGTDVQQNEGQRCAVGRRIQGEEYAAIKSDIVELKFGGNAKQRRGMGVVRGGI